MSKITTYKEGSHLIACICNLGNADNTYELVGKLKFNEPMKIDDLNKEISESLLSFFSIESKNEDKNIQKYDILENLIRQGAAILIQSENSDCNINEELNNIMSGFSKYLNNKINNI